jgi:hypothetical protein
MFWHLGSAGQKIRDQTANKPPAKASEQFLKMDEIVIRPFRSEVTSSPHH